jgi:hypothetical protein
MTDTPTRLHPSITAALDRDGVSLARVAELVGMDVRTIEKVRLDGPTEERAVTYRRLDAWIEGRARAVKGAPNNDGKRWRLDELGGGVSAADVATVAERLLVMADEAERNAAQLRDAARKLGSESPSCSTAKDDVNQLFLSKYAFVDDPGLPGGRGVSYGGDMNAQLLHAAADQVNARSKGRLKMYNQRVPEDFPERIKRSAEKARLTPADFLRALIELHTEAIEE